MVEIACGNFHGHYSVDRRQKAWLLRGQPPRSLCRLRMWGAPSALWPLIGGSLYYFSKLGRRRTGGALAFAFNHHTDDGLRT